MREAYEQLLKLRKKWLELEHVLEERVENSPRGRIQSTLSKKKYPQFYIFEETKQGYEKRYARKAEMGLVRKIAQREYDEEVLKIVRERRTKIEEFIGNMDKRSLEDIYNNSCASRKMLITPIEWSDDEYIEKWIEKMELNGNTYPKPSNIITEKGEQVRSKTEKIIADKLYYNNIPYVYEPKIVLQDGRCLFPDFCMLNLRLRKTFYLEHFGMMDNPEYSARTVEKIEEYQRCGYWQGKNMLYTFETQNRMPDMRNLDNMIKTYLK